MATRRGQIKKTPLEEFANVRRAGLIAFNITDGDALVRATYAHEGDDVIVITDAGLAVRFPVNSLRSASRGSGGVRAIQVPDASALIGVEAVKEGHEFLTITTRGYGKRTKVTEYPQKGRGGKGMIGHKVTDKTGPVVALHQVSGEEEVVLIAEGGKFLRTRVNQIAEVGRSTQGVKVMSTDDDRVAAVAVVDMSRSFGEKPGLNDARLNDGDAPNGAETSATEAIPDSPSDEPPGKNGRKPRRNGKT